jgi:hypothetical protein
MARTYVHIPFRVKMRMPHFRHAFTEIHDHRFGPCDLTEPRPFDRRHRCYTEFVCTGHNIHCGCKMCTGQVWRKQERRRERYAGRRECRDSSTS